MIFSTCDSCQGNSHPTMDNDINGHTTCRFCRVCQPKWFAARAQEERLSRRKARAYYRSMPPADPKAPITVYHLTATGFDPVYYGPMDEQPRSGEIPLWVMEITACA